MAIPLALALCADSAYAQAPAPTPGIRGQGSAGSPGVPQAIPGQAAPGPAGAQPAPVAPPDVMIVITSDGRSLDHLGAAYSGKVSTQQIRQDFAGLAREFGVQPGKAKVSNKRGIPGGEVRLKGVVDWSTGLIHLEPILRTYRRYPFLRVAVVFDRPFPLANLGEPIREGYRVETRGGGTVIDYLLHRTDGTEAPAGAQPTKTERSRLPGWLPFLALGLIAIVVGGGVFWIVRNILGERRAASEGGKR